MSALTPRPGRIEVICGCMFAGKTARLIADLESAYRAGWSVRAFKHRIDVRYGPDRLATHDGRRYPAQAVASAAEVQAAARPGEVIGIDEGQFFGIDLLEACGALRRLGCRVIVAGIDHDAWGRPFTPIPELKARADEVTLLFVPCGVCGQPARYSQRMVPIAGDNMIGGPGEYAPRCRQCFQPVGSPAPAQ